VINRLAKIGHRDADIILRLYALYDGHREALLWFLHELDAKNYDDYKKRYLGISKERAHFTSVCGFFELAGVLVRRRLVNSELFFDVFNPSPYWQRAKAIVDGMRGDRAHIYENFEFLANMRKEWARSRPCLRGSRRGARSGERSR
jgi:hypothetical protein